MSTVDSPFDYLYESARISLRGCRAARRGSSLLLPLFEDKKCLPIKKRAADSIYQSIRAQHAASSSRRRPPDEGLNMH